MSIYRYCGAGSLVGALKLSKFGQSVDLADSAVKNAVLGGVALVPANDPLWPAFTEQELSLYGNPLTHGHANGAFRAKKQKIQAAAAELRGRYEAEAAAALAAAPPAAPEAAPDANHPDANQAEAPAQTADESEQPAPAAE